MSVIRSFIFLNIKYEYNITLIILVKQFDKDFPQLCLDVDLNYSDSSNYFYTNPTDLCVVPRVGGFLLGKLVSILSNENKRLEVAFTHITLIGPCLHTQKLCRTLYEVVENALDTLVTIGSYVEHIAQYLSPHHVNTIVLFKVVFIVHYLSYEFPEFSRRQVMF